jgi:hypothetical protein
MSAQLPLCQVHQPIIIATAVTTMSKQLLAWAGQPVQTPLFRMMVFQVEAYGEFKYFKEKMGQKQALSHGHI